MLKIWGLLPVAVSLVLMAILKIQGSPVVYEAPMLLAFLNTFFMCAIPLVGAYAAAKSYQSTGILAFLMLGSGFMVVGISNLYVGWMIFLEGGSNPIVTLHNLGSLFAGIFQFAGAHFFIQILTGVPEKRNRIHRYGIIYAGIFVFVSIMAVLAFRGNLPSFFDPLTGPSLLRQIVLGGAVFLFAVTGLAFLEMYGTTKTEFAYWYGLAVWLISIGLTGVLFQPSVGSALGWVGRAAQYVGGVYFIFAFLQGWQEDSSSADGKGWALWPYLERKIGERTIELNQINAELQEEMAEHKRTEEALRESESRFHLMFEYHDAVMLLVDPDSSQIIDANESAEKFYGYSISKMKGMSINDISTLPSEEVKRLSQQSVQSGLKNFIVPHRLASGEIKTVEVHSSPFTLNGKTSLFAVIHDITARRQAEDLLERTRENYTTFFNSIDDFLFILDEQGNILHTNNVVNNRLGYSVEELFGKSVLMVHPPERREEAGRIVGEMLAGTAQFCPVPIMTKSGEEISVETKVTPGFWDGKPVIFGVTKDISQIKLSEEKFSKAFQSNSALMALSHLEDGTYIEVNDIFLETLGFARDEVVGEKSSELGLFAKPDERGQVIEAIKKNGTVKDFEVTVRAKDGSLRTGLFSADTIYIGKDLCLLTVMVDITERKQTEEALQESEKRFREVLENSLDASYKRDLQTNAYTYLSPVFTRIAGYTLDEMISMPIETLLGLIHPDDAPELNRVITEALSSPVSKENQVDYRFKHKNNGEYLWLHDQFVAMRDAQGKPVSLIGGVSDITERKQIEAALQDSETNLRAVFNAATDESIYLIAADETLLALNDFVAQKMGQSREALVGRKLFSLMSADDAAHYRPFIQRALLNGEDVLFEDEWNDRWLLYHFYPILNGDGQVVRLAVYSRDITLQKQAEELSRLQGNELEKRVQERTAELVHANRAKDEFLAAVSHELRTPLSSILGFSELLLEGIRGPMSEKQEQAVQMIQSGGNHLLELINEILDISKIESGKFEIRPELIDVNEICQSSLEYVQQMANKKSITVEYSPPPIASSIFADPKRLKQILVNLLSNAVKFTPEQGKVKLEVQPNVEEGLMRFSITDTGIGIGSDDLQKIFKPFMQVDSGLSRQYEGTGLGLALVQKMVEQHNGSIEVQSEIGVGSRFTFVLPWNE